jgi:hypothetical protein
MDAGTIIVSVVKELFPWSEIVDAWRTYIEYKARIREIDSMERRYLAKVDAFTEYVRAQKEVLLVRLQNDKESSGARMRQMESQLHQKKITQDELILISEAIRKRFNASDGDERKAAREASLVIAPLMVQNSISALDLLSKDIELQLRTIDLIDLRPIKQQLLE